MRWFRGLSHTFRRARTLREIQEELESHIEEAIENGRDPDEARRAFGSMLRVREQSLDVKLLVWLETLAQDTVFGLRQLRRHSATSLAALAALTLAIGASTATFRLLDELLLRPLPVERPEDLFVLELTSTAPDFDDTWDTVPHPMFQELRETAAQYATLFAASRAASFEAAFDGGPEEVTEVQLVSADFFAQLGVGVASGTLFPADGELVHGAQPYAVLSHRFWVDRFGADPAVVGRSVLLGDQHLTIVGVTEPSFRGVEPGVQPELFVPLVVSRRFDDPDWSGFRAFGRWRDRSAGAALESQLEATWRRLEHDRWTRIGMASERWIDTYVASTHLTLQDAGAGVSRHQRAYGPALRILFALAALVLVVAAANVVHLRIALVAARHRELTLRTSIGAGAWRLLRLLLLEAAILVSFATVLGVVASAWAARWVVGLLAEARHTVDLSLVTDSRTWAYGALAGLLTLVVCGLLPSLLAALRHGGTRTRLSANGFGRLAMATQVAFCTLVVLVGSQFAASLTRLYSIPVGFEAEQLSNLELTAQPEQPDAIWQEITQRVATLPGVDGAALAGWPLLHGSSTNALIGLDGGPPSESLAEFYCVSHGWQETVGARVVSGMPFRSGASYPDVAMVNEEFERRFLGGRNAVGLTVERVGEANRRTPLRVVATLADLHLKDLHSPIPPTVFVPCRARVDGDPRDRSWGTVVARHDTTTESLLGGVRSMLEEYPQFRLRDGAAQAAFVDRQLVRERLLAALGTFFSVVVLLLVGVGLFGVVHHGLQLRRREIGLRMALGGRPLEVLAEASRATLLLTLAGMALGLMGGWAATRFAASLLYDFDSAGSSAVAVPFLAVVATVVLACVPALVPPLRTSPARVLRSE